MQTTPLHLETTLPLTCSRAGTCCHGNQVLLNPWELFCLAKEKKMSTRLFRDQYTTFGGMHLLFDGKTTWKGKSACSLYLENFGCSVHAGRPLACRLFPLGRQIQSSTIQYIYQGEKFPCLVDCPEVVKLPQMSVGDYLKEQKTEPFEMAQDAYLEVMQNIADLAFEFLLDTGLAESGDTKTLSLWRKMGKESAEDLAKRMSQKWMDLVMVPEISGETTDPISFIQKHAELVQLHVQESFGALQTMEELHEASVLLMGIALQLARCLGANPEILAEHWCETAHGFGAFG